MTPRRAARARLLAAGQGLALCVLPATLACFHVLNRDIGFHVATGRAIDESGAVPTTNVLSFTNPDHPWILHQWIPAWIFHRVDRRHGAEGLVWLKVAIVTATFLFLWLALRRRAGSGALAAAALWFVLAACAAATRYYVRPFVFSMLCLAVFLWGLSHLPPPGAERARWRPFVAITLISGPLCSVLHAGFVYLLIAGGAVLAAGVLLRRSWRALALWYVALLGLSAVLLELANPYGARVLLLPFTFSVDEYWHEHLVEYRPPVFDLALFGALWGGMALSWVAGAGVAVSRWRARGVDGLKDTLLLAGFGSLLFFTWLVLRHERTVFAWALVTAFYAAGWTAELARKAPGPSIRRGLTAAFVLLAVLVGANGLRVWVEHARIGPGLDPRSYPARLFGFVATEQLPDQVYVSDAWGGHFLWAFYPERRVFYDNRLEAYPFEFFVDTYQAIRYGEPGWEDKLRAHDVKTALLRYSTAGERRYLEGRPSVRQLMLRSEDWRCVYWDDHGLIFVRRDALPRGCDRCGDFRALDPDLDRPVGTDPAPVLRELRRVLQLSGPSGRVYVALTRASLWAGDRASAEEWLQEGLRRFPEHPMLQQMAETIAR